jgi:hypothetical protein
MLVIAGWIRMGLTAGRVHPTQSSSPFGVTEMLVEVSAVNLLLLASSRSPSLVDRAVG